MDGTYPFKIILGSSSIARKNLLTEMGYNFTIMTADIDEKAIRKEKPDELVLALAEAKADAILSKIQIVDKVKDAEQTVLIASDTAKTITKKISDHNIMDAETTILVTCDQVVVSEGGIIREKPCNEDEAREFINGYSGRHVQTVSSVFVTNIQTGLRIGGCDIVKVYFDKIPDEIIEKLIHEGLVLNVAGGLIIEHPLIIPFVKQLEGTTDSVMGLPRKLTQTLIQRALQPHSTTSC